MTTTTAVLCIIAWVLTLAYWLLLPCAMKALWGCTGALTKALWAVTAIVETLATTTLIIMTMRLTGWII